MNIGKEIVIGYDPKETGTGFHKSSFGYNVNGIVLFRVAVLRTILRCPQAQDLDINPSSRSLSPPF
jgi:hypothetical protein